MSITYQYNPHRHTKIWLSNNSSVFMNLENKIRLIAMRETNPDDEIHLIYDATLLNATALILLNEFCTEYRIYPVNADAFTLKLKSDNEKKLYAFYKEEIHHLSEGGNLAVASDILRWLSPVFKLGTYTDFDFPVDTTKFPERLLVEAPLLLNIGSLKMGNLEFILTNNDYVAIVDEDAAKKQIESTQAGIISKLEQYDTDFIESTENTLSQGGRFNRYLLKFMKNRSESLYIAKSKEIKPNHSSRIVRSYIHEIMSDTLLFIDFNRLSKSESEKAVIHRLRQGLQEQRNFIKYFFFSKEYAEIKQVLQQEDTTVLNYLMKKELNNYLRSIIVCTTGPIEISHALFGAYVFSTDDFIKYVKPFSFHHYNLQKAFQSPNSIPIHESIFGMLRFLGASEGELNDSSWLESGRQLQQIRIEKLQIQQKQLAANLPGALLEIKEQIIQELSINPRSQALQSVLSCFHDDLFDVEAFRNQDLISSGLRFNRSQKLIKSLRVLSNDAVRFALIKQGKIALHGIKVGELLR